jgi:hypothetical protein
MTHTMGVIAHQGPSLQQEPATRRWHEEEHVTEGGWQLPGCGVRSSWPGAELVLPKDLQRAACGQLPLHEACQTLAHYQEEQARAAVDLLERETWAVTVLLAASGPIWHRVGRPTLRFTLPRAVESVLCHLEVGYFSHLAVLSAPSAGERALVSARTPGWARVYPHLERQRAGQTGAAAYSYEPIPTAEAVATLGFGRILSEIEVATLATGQAILARAQEQAARSERLQRVEQMLGWGHEPVETARERRPLSYADQMLALLVRGGSRRLTVGAAFLGLVMAVLAFFVGIPVLLLPLIFIAPALSLAVPQHSLFWYRIVHAQRS